MEHKSINYSLNLCFLQKSIKPLVRLEQSNNLMALWVELCKECECVMFRVYFCKMIKIWKYRVFILVKKCFSLYCLIIDQMYLNWANVTEPISFFHKWIECWTIMWLSTYDWEQYSTTFVKPVSNRSCLYFDKLLKLKTFIRSIPGAWVTFWKRTFCHLRRNLWTINALERLQ